MKLLFCTFNILLLFLCSGCSNKVDKVKDSVWEGDKSLTIGQALDNYKYFEKKNWEVIKTENGMEFVEFTGTLKPAERISEIDKEYNELKAEYNKLKTDLENDKKKLDDNDWYTIILYSQCLQYELKDECVTNEYYYKHKNKTGTNLYKSYVDSANDKYKFRHNKLAEYETKTKAYDNELDFYKNNRINVVYQFIINQDKTIQISFGGVYKSNNKNETIAFGNHLTTLERIYKNEPCSFLLMVSFP